MTTNLIYQKIMAEMPEGLEKAIMLVLSSHVGSDRRISKGILYKTLKRSFRPFFSAKTATIDRQVRQAIENLRLDGYPVLSDSGSGGYWLGKRGEVMEFAAEMEARQASLVAVIRSLRTSVKIYWIDPPEPPKQATLW